MNSVVSTTFTTKTAYTTPEELRTQLLIKIRKDGPANNGNRDDIQLSSRFTTALQKLVKNRIKRIQIQNWNTAIQILDTANHEFLETMQTCFKT